MPAVTPIVLADRQATPVNHTFSPVAPQNGVAKFVNGSSGVPVGNEVLTVSTKQLAGKVKHKVVFTVPVVQTQVTNGISVPVVVRTAYAEVNFSFDSTSSTQERKDLVGMVASSLAATQVAMNAVLVDLSGFY